MRQKYLDAVTRSAPYLALLDAGASPTDIKSAIVKVLYPYVVDKELLNTCAVSVLANEAVCVAQLSSRPDWKSLLEETVSLRDSAIAIDKQQSFKVLCFFEEAIRDAQR